jgi:hypothetical protein
MYTLDQMIAGIKYPELIISELNRQYTRRKKGQPYNTDGIDIFEEDWDNLVILDACRYDEFAAQSPLPGSLESRISRGSATREFIRGNFRDRTLHDVVYVSANEWYAKLREEINAELHAFEFVDRDAMNGLTSRPETVTNAAQEAAETYPDKRLIVHYMQPHSPFLGETGTHIDHAGGLMMTVKRNDLNHRDIVRAYRENLDLVLQSVDSLLEHLSGLTVVTADHGELLGECERPLPIKRYSHPIHIYVEELVKVPWLIHRDGTRKTVIAEEPAEEIEDFDVDDLRDRLKDLGYRI